MNCSMTLIEHALKKQVTPAMKRICDAEGIDVRRLQRLIAAGTVVIPQNRTRIIKEPCGIGRGLLTKVNANIGISTDASALQEELNKLETAVRCGADTVMDLSVGEDIPGIRKAIIAHSAVPVGTVPLYEIAVNAARKKGDFLSFDADDIFGVLEQQGRDGVDFFTIHAGVTRKTVRGLIKEKRIMDIVSRGGAILAAWMQRHKKENPFFESFGRVLDIAHKYDVTLSLGDGLRPGSIFDATDAAQLGELRLLGELARDCRRRKVQVMIEGPGHVPLDQIEENVRLQKKICGEIPFYVLGPLVTDIASGYDHISAAIGGAIAASAGADFLCYVTPAEHLRLPSLEDVREGVIATRLAAHAADIVKRHRAALRWDTKMSLARKKRDWQEQVRLSIDPEKAAAYRASGRPRDAEVCTMCGDFCSIKVMGDCVKVSP